MDRTAIIEALKNQRDHLRGLGVEHLAIFGSRAREDGKTDSDLDILLDVSWGSRFSLLDLVGIEHELSSRTGLRANAFMRRSLDKAYIEKIGHDVIEVF